MAGRSGVRAGASPAHSLRARPTATAGCASSCRAPPLDRQQLVAGVTDGLLAASPPAAPAGGLAADRPAGRLKGLSRSSRAWRGIELAIRKEEARRPASEHGGDRIDLMQRAHTDRWGPMA